MLLRDVRFVGWDAWVRLELRGDRFVEAIRALCPGLPSLEGVDGASIGFAPSLLIGYGLRAGIPIYFVLHDRALPRALVAFVIGRLAFRLLDRRWLPRLDGVHRRWWERRSMAKTSSARITTVAERVSQHALRWAGLTCGTGIALACTVWIISGTSGAHSVVLADLGALAVLAGLLALVLVLVMFVAMIVELMAPTLLGPASSSGHVISRAEVTALRPLLDTRPARIVRDLWELVQALKP